MSRQGSQLPCHYSPPAQKEDGNLQANPSGSFSNNDEFFIIVSDGEGISAAVMMLILFKYRQTQTCKCCKILSQAY